jgi:hypothetical protein
MKLASASTPPPQESESAMRAAVARRQHEIFDDDGLIASNRDEMLLGVQRFALFLLWEMRCRAAQFALGFQTWAEDIGVDLTILYDRVELGERVGFTVEEDTRFGTEAIGRKPFLRKRKDGSVVEVTACRFPPMVPISETSEECDKRRRKVGRERRKSMEQARHAEELAVINAITGTLAERRLATLLAVLPTSRNEAITLAEAVERVSRHEAWASLTSASMRELVRRMVHGNGGRLIASRAARKDYTKLLIWRFAAAISDKTSRNPCAAANSPVQNLPGNPCPSLLLIDREDPVPPQESGCQRTESPETPPDLSTHVHEERPQASEPPQDAGTEHEERERADATHTTKRKQNWTAGLTLAQRAISTILQKSPDLDSLALLRETALAQSEAEKIDEVDRRAALSRPTAKVTSLAAHRARLLGGAA